MAVTRVRLLSRRPILRARTLKHGSKAASFAQAVNGPLAGASGVGERSRVVVVGPSFPTARRSRRFRHLFDCSLLLDEPRDGVAAALGLGACLVDAVEQGLRLRVLGLELPLPVADLHIQALHILQVAAHGGESARSGGAVRWSTSHREM